MLIYLTVLRCCAVPSARSWRAGRSPSLQGNSDNRSMKAFMLLALAGLSPLVFAAAPEQPAPAETEPYHYGMELDIARVISRSEVPDVCGVVPAYLTYEDHQGKVHRLEYMVFGNGCSNG